MSDDDILARENASIEQQAAWILAKEKIETEGETEKADKAIRDLLDVKTP